MEINEKQQKNIEKIAEKYGLKLILLFGSQASGDTHSESDFDIAYVSERKLSFEEECQLNFEFTENLPGDRVDTVDIKKASPLLMRSIFKNPQILYKKDGMVFPTYRSYAFKLFVEAKPLYEIKKSYLEKQLKT